MEVVVVDAFVIGGGEACDGLALLIEELDIEMTVGGAVHVYRKGVIGYRKGVIGCRKGVIGCRKGVIGCRKGVIGCRKGVIGCHKGVIGCRKGVIGCQKGLIGFQEETRVCRGESGVGCRELLLR